MKLINYILFLGLLYSCSSGESKAKDETVIKEETIFAG